jgi:hypothetical protein
MRDGEGLPESSSSHCACGLFGKDTVDVEMEGAEIVAHQEQRTIPKCANVDLRRRTFVETRM